MKLVIYVDGGARGNPGPAGAGVVVAAADGSLIHEGAYFLGQQTNNAAEYYALIRALQRITQMEVETVSICSDSELLVRQITGEYRVKNPRLAQLYQQVQLLLLKIPRWHIRHVARQANQRADQLANLAMDQQRDLIVFDADQAGQQAPPASETGPQPSADTSSAAAQAPESAEAATEGPRAARVTLARPPRPGGCPAGQCMAESFTVEQTLPSELCIHAAHALLPTILAILNTEPTEFAAIPTLTVRCMRPGCGATFHVSPARGSNGITHNDDTP